MIDLEFDDVAGADALLGILSERIWASPGNSPDLAGQPNARTYRSHVKCQPGTA